MNKEAKSILILGYVITIILVFVLASSDNQRVIALVGTSILFGVGGTLVDRDIRNLKRKEKERDMVNRIIRTSKNIRKNYN